MASANPNPNPSLNNPSHDELVARIEKLERLVQQHEIQLMYQSSINFGLLNILSKIPGALDNIEVTSNKRRRRNNKAAADEVDADALSSNER